MKHLFTQLVLILFVIGDLTAQIHKSYSEDSIRAILAKTPMDTTRVNLLNDLAGSYFFKHPDSTLFYAHQALILARKLNYTSGIQYALLRAGEANRHLGNVVEALKIQSEAIDFNRKVKNVHFEANAIGHLGLDYFELHDYKKALGYLKQAVGIRKTLQRREPTEALFNIYIGYIYNHYNRPDSALYFLNEAARYHMLGQLRILRAIGLADVFVQIDNMDSANYYYRRALKFIFEDPENTPNHLSMLGIKLSKVFDLQNKRDSSLYFARYAFFVSNKKNLNLRILESSNQLSQIFKKKGMLDSALYYQDISIALNDNIFGKENYQQLQLLLLDEQRQNQERQSAEEKRLLEAEQARERFQNNLLIVGLLTVTMTILIASIMLFRSNRIKQKTNLFLQQALGELKATQSQLIQSEKMATLGELTAGIAHEIQNPLNFVNNFSEVNKELTDELEQEIDKGNTADAKMLARDIKENQDKILHHGKRADAIVKGMLQHSRTGSGQKEPTDINLLCGEYLRLAFHGLRAKDKSFNAKFETSFDETIGKINVVPQDLGRVILNLINNAFYAVAEKSSAARATADKNYDPIVSVSTKNYNGKIMISVKDNGNGIPQRILDKIFQPFFTTKPTGQGTGLGLSLSYDIVKAHGGEIKIDTQENHGTEFSVTLPI